MSHEAVGAQKEPKHDIFLSYSKLDRAHVEELAHELIALGYLVWWDHELHGGVLFPKKIKEELESSKSLIVLWSPTSVLSQWVLSEVTHAFNKRLVIIPLRSQELTVEELPLPFTVQQTLELENRPGLFHSLRKSGIVPSSTPVPPPQRNDGRIDVHAAVINNKHGSRFLPGAGRQEWFRDIPLGPEMVVVPGIVTGSGQSAPFAVGRFSVLFDEWDAAHAAGGVSHCPSDQGWGRGRRPVINVSWGQAQDFVSWLSKATGKKYRLLSEAEWEHSCQAGEGAKSCVLTEKDARFSKQLFEAGETVEAGTLGSPNAFGLHDMRGNVWEWCQDVWTVAPLRSGVASQAIFRAARGGSYNSLIEDIECTSRAGYTAANGQSYIGFRVARDLA